MRLVRLVVLIMLGLTLGVAAQAQTRVVAPLTGTVNAGSWTCDQTINVGAMPHGYMAYSFMLPQGYDPNANIIYPLVIYEHWNDGGMNGGSYYGGGCPGGEAGGSLDTANMRRNFPAIVVAPKADQSIDTSGANANANFGGYLDSPNSGGNEQGVVALVNYFKANYKVDPTRIYCTGDSLGGIGCLAQIVDNNMVNGSNKLFAAAMSFSDQLYRPCCANSDQFSRMTTVPFLAASTPYDNVESSYDMPAYAYYAGNQNYPSKSAYDAQGVNALRAGSSNYYYLRLTDSTMPWTYFRKLNADGGDGTQMFTWLFSQIAGNVETLAITTIGVQQQSTAFTVSGTISGVSAAPTLQYRDDSGAWLALPSGASVTGSSFSFSHPGMAAGAHTVSVRDAANTSIAVTSNSFNVSAGESANLTTVTTVGPTITDQAGHAWALANGGIVTRDGGSVAQPPGSGSVVVTPTNGNTITDSQGHKWTLTAAGDIMEDGAAIPGGAGTAQIVYSNNTVYFQDASSQAWFTWDGTQFVAASAPSSTGSVSELAYANHTVYAQVTGGSWYSWNGTQWSGPVSSPLPQTETLTINTIQTQPVNTSFTVSGTISGVSAAPTLQYRDGTGAWQPLPGGTTSGTRLWYRHPGGNGSVWNTPIGDGATWSAAGDADTIDIARGWNGSNYTAGPVGIINTVDNFGFTQWVGTSGDSTYTINIAVNGRTQAPDNGATATWTLHVPTGAYSPGPYPADNSIGFFDTASGNTRIYGTGLNLAAPGFQPGGGPYPGQLGEWDDATSDKMGEDADTGNSGFIVGIGTISSCDTDPSCNPVYPKIQHGLRYSTDAHLLKSNATTPGGQVLKPDSWPLRLQDGQTGGNVYSGNLTAGATLGIPITTSMPAGLDANCQGLFWTMQHYGLYFRDQAGGGFHLTADQGASSSTWASSARSCLPQLVSLLRVMRNQHQTGQSFTTNPKNGPGNRLDTGPPLLAGTSGSPGGNVTSTSFSFLHPGMAASTGNTVSIRDANNTSITATSNAFIVGSSSQESLSINTIGSQVANTPFTVSGTVALPTTGGTGTGPTGTYFTVKNGNIYDPQGNLWKGHGINVADVGWSDAVQSSNGAPLLTQTFPNTNFVRLNIGSYQDYSGFDQGIQWLTANKVVVLVEDHSGYGGNKDPPVSGSGLTQSNNFFTSWATKYKNNPYVWFASLNEPGYNCGGACVSQNHQQVYNAVRNTGNGTVVLFDPIGGGDPVGLGNSGCGNCLVASTYTNMHNVIWDIHYYAWVIPNGGQNNTNYSDAVNKLSSMLSLAGQFTSSDGPIPIIIGEFGDSTDGVSVDPAGMNVVNAVLSNTVALGFAPWNWYAYSANGDKLQVSHTPTNPYGSTVATAIANATNPSPPPPTTPPTLQYQVNGGAWALLPSGSTVTTTNFSYTQPGLPASAANTIAVRDANNTSVSATSNSFAVTSTAVETLGINTIATQRVGASYTVSGTIANATSAPSLQYQDNTGAWQALPGGATVSSTAFSFTHPAPTATNASATISVRDAANTAITTTSNAYKILPAESANNSVVTTVGPAIVDASGESFTITSGHQVAVDGVTDTTTSNVVAIAYVNHTVWYENASLLWFSKTQAANAWTPTGGTSTSPLPAETLSINTIGGQQQGVSFPVSGTIGNALTVPALQYSVSGGAWLDLPSGSAVTVTGFSFQVPGIASAGTASISVRDKNNTSISTFSNSFPVSAPITETLAIQQIPTQAVGRTFAVSGTITGASSPPTLQFQDNGGLWQALPAGASVTTTGFSFVHPGLPGTQGMVVSVRDAQKQSVTANSNSFVVIAQESANLTTVTSVGPAIVDQYGIAYTLTSAGQVAINGVPDVTTSNVIELAYVNRAVWYENSALHWWSRALAGQWGPTGGSLLGPVPSSKPTVYFTSNKRLAVVPGFSIMIPGVQINDTVVNGNFNLKLTAVDGVLSMPAATGVGTATLTYVCSLAQCNTALGQLQFTGKTVGAGSVTITVTDPAGQSASGSVAITVPRSAATLQ